MTKKALWTKLPRYRKRAQAKPRKFIRARTPSRAKEERVYRKRVKLWLLLPWAKWCVACEPRGLSIQRATQCHHAFGRRGNLLLLEKHWMPVCSRCHSWVHNNVQKARELGLLAPLGHFNTQPKTHEPRI